MPGDVVRRMIKGKDTQRGYCRDIKVTACVQVVGTKQVIPSVKSENLVPLEVSGNADTIFSLVLELRVKKENAIHAILLCNRNSQLI